MTTAAPQPDWWLYRGDGIPATDERRLSLPAPPPWRAFDGEPLQPSPPELDEYTYRKLGRSDTRPVRRAPQDECDLVNAALWVRRPLLVTGSPGTGKSAIAFRIARELRLGRVLEWPITSRTTLRSGLYEYDAIGRAQDRGIDAPTSSRIGDFVRLGPLGTALLAYERPRVLLVDELDKSDIDLPNDLLHILESGQYTVPELVRASGREAESAVYTDDPDRRAVIRDGRVGCRAFPIVVITSNGERDFPPAFRRRCLVLDLPLPGAEDLAAMVKAQLPSLEDEQRRLIDDFLARPPGDNLARDQLLNAVYLTASGVYAQDRESWQRLVTSLWHSLSLDR
jgi:MoxR-like ATPase